MHEVLMQFLANYGGTILKFGVFLTVGGLVLGTVAIVRKRR